LAQYRRFVRTDEPAPQLPPAVVVLADENARNRIMAASLALDLIPYLPVATGVARAVVGPLVLPGRTACLACLDRIRQDADPGWQAVADALRTGCPGPSPVLAASAAALAAEQVLDHLDAIDRPTSVDATLEWQTGGQRARRRSWFQHPECGCRQLTP
jgi:bacteriocin biosynthesis cyclodehydratase domain-containing protein